MSLYAGLLLLNLTFADAGTASIQPWLADAWSKLPPLVQTEFGSIEALPIPQFKELGKGGFFLPACTPGPHPEVKHPVRYGRAITVPGQKPKILLHEGFIAEIEKGKESCGYQFAVSTLIHEWIHIYDAKYKLSKNPRFLALTHFQRIHNWKTDILFMGLYPGEITQKNAHPHRSPDPYEFKNPREMFAVNFEHFILDPEFACRRPSLHAFYTEKFGDPFLATRTCKTNTELTLNSRNLLADMKIPADLDPARISEVHYLFAAKGSEMMSRWGHAMYRFVVCAPERKVVGPECRQDIAYHVVISYRANVSDVKLNQLKGITGGYASKMFLFPFVEMITEYTKEELRDLISIPIKLNETEKRAFVESALETYWTYSGRYTFLTNNCGTESLLLLKSSSEAVNRSKIHSFSPYKLLKTMTKSGWLDRQNEIVYRSKRADFDKALVVLGISRAEYFAKNSSQRSAFVLAKINSLPEKREQIAAAAFVIETVVEFERTKALEQLLLEKVEKADPKTAEDIHAFAQATQSQESWSATSSGYGIPLSQDFANRSDRSDQSRGDAVKAFADWAGKTFDAQITEIKNTRANKAQFRKWILTQP